MQRRIPPGSELVQPGRCSIPHARPHAYAAADAHGDARGISYAHGDLHAHADGNAHRNAAAHRDARGISHAHGDLHAHTDADGNTHRDTTSPRTPHPHSNGFFHANGNAGQWGCPASPSTSRWGSWGGWRKRSAGHDRAPARHRMGVAGACGGRGSGAPGLPDHPQTTPALNGRSAEAPRRSSGKLAGGTPGVAFPNGTKGLSHKQRTAYN